MATQEVFQHCYRNRQRDVHHMAYMRMAKVLVALELLESEGITLQGKKIFDYGFGAGTFFRYCPVDSWLSGVEVDPQTVAEVSTMLHARGYARVDLRAIEISQWQLHPLLDSRYDVILCSHVLEHMDDPLSLVARLGKALNPGGALIGLVPLNERAENVHHVTRVDEAMIEGWTKDCGLKKTRYIERDPLFYWPQFVFAEEGARWKHKVAQALSITAGVPATMLGHQRWLYLSNLVGRFTASKPTQAGFVLRRPVE